MLLDAMSAVLRRWQGDLTQSEIARRAGVSQPTVRAVLLGLSQPKDETLAAICAALGRTEDELMRDMAAGSVEVSP